MKKSVSTKGLAAALGLTLAALPGALPAQNTASNSYLLNRNNPYFGQRYVYVPPVQMVSANPVTVGPGQGPTGSSFLVRTNGNLGGTPIFVTFASSPYTGAPVAFSSRLSGSGNSFSTPVPAQLCLYGTRSWDIFVKLSNGREFARIGTFTPTNCRR